jgi:hypothetical protein
MMLEDETSLNSNITAAFPFVSVLCYPILDSMALLGGSSIQYCVSGQ